jgi:hypothetical protein
MTNDVLAAFNQLKVHPDYAALFSYRLERVVVVPLRGCFGWRLTPGFFDLFAQAIRALVRAATPDSPVSDAARALAREHMRVVRPPAGATARLLTPDPLARARQLDASAPYDCSIYVDDSAVADVRVDCLEHLCAVVFDAHLSVLGGYHPEVRGCPLALDKMSPYSTAPSFLGLVIDTMEGEIRFAPGKWAKLVQLVTVDFAPGRSQAPLHEVRSLLGHLWRFSMVVRAGRYFLWWLQRTVAWAQQEHRSEQGPVPLGPGAHRDLAWWRWRIALPAANSCSLSHPSWAHVKRAPGATSVTDASGWGMGGFCREAGILWQVQWPPAIAALFLEDQPPLSEAEQLAAHEDPEVCHYGEALFINELELCGMAVGTWMALQDEALVHNLRTSETSMVLFGDNVPAVQWIKKAGCTKRVHNAGELIRFMGALEATKDVCFEVKHVKGVDNIIADYASRGVIGSPDHPAHGSAPDLSGLTLVQVPAPILDAVFGMLVMSSGFTASRTLL